MSIQAKQFTGSLNAYAYFVLTSKYERSDMELAWLRHYAACLIAGISF